MGFLLIMQVEPWASRYKKGGFAQQLRNENIEWKHLQLSYSFVFKPKEELKEPICLQFRTIDNLKSEDVQCTLQFPRIALAPLTQIRQGYHPLGLASTHSGDIQLIWQVYDLATEYGRRHMLSQSGGLPATDVPYGPARSDWAEDNRHRKGRNAMQHDNKPQVLGPVQHAISQQKLETVAWYRTFRVSGISLQGYEWQSLECQWIRERSTSRTLSPEPFYPLHEHPASLAYPQLPSSPRPPAFHDLYTLSTHIIPAAYPRVVPDIPIPEAPSQYTDKEERKRHVQRLGGEIAERQELFGRGQLPGEPSRKVLWNCINRYVKNTHSTDNKSKGVTLLLAHANGFPKEIWETTLRYLFSSPEGPPIDEVWSFEAVQHGDSALLNASNLSGICKMLFARPSVPVANGSTVDEWMDNARDIANFLLNYIPSAVSNTVLSTHLPRVSNDATLLEAARREVMAALKFPALFSSMILIDPVIVQPYQYRGDSLRAFVIGAILRRDRWPSREEALRMFKASPFFAAWHPDVLQLYVDYGLTDTPEGEVKLKMSGMHEALSFANNLASNETWELLENLDKKIELRWIVPGKPKDKGIQGEEATRIRVWRRPENSSNIVIHSAGHLVVQESPQELAQNISDFLKRKYKATGMKAQL
ncbi:hypothetical protein SERLA73DRAFT_72062 [Serpula lacrymans var. lacrymans S7.3]|uniref:AB hydrolase-1 domain-containing protein n=1 Tax=Serpula lacrymans var. lacrymans (strain S7.3) TaxID=936435 RepID=F8PTU7_SERL3|nr:hypothetical protein SERLA73DRAFT_72062 [Serpula lacrymans var. lacrymans S7.3]